MSDTVFFTRPAPRASAAKDAWARITAVAEGILAVLGEWRHNYRSRRELASYSRRERADFCFSGEVDAEIAKPFWKK